jgi:diaminopimelate epimerase
MQRHFLKMNGTGNDFVVFDARRGPVALSPDLIRALAARDNNITGGCDQVIVMEPSKKADIFMRIYNADGGEVDACGNATRCIGWKIIEAKGDPNYLASVETNAGMLTTQQVVRSDLPVNRYGDSDALIEADMGKPVFTPSQIPVSGEYDEATLRNIAATLGIEGLLSATCVGMGNPHVVFFVNKLPGLPFLEVAGEHIKSAPLFMPHGVNLTIAEVADTAIFAYVYERGAGITKSCGTAACATGVAAVTLGYREKNTNILIQQRQRRAEDLYVRWSSKSDHVHLIGPVKTEFERIVSL